VLIVKQDDRGPVEGNQRADLLRETLVDLVDIQRRGDDAADLGQRGFLFGLDLAKLEVP
jgi:hypothetical protein